ncbi:MAG TPA: hypothetical protein VJH03_08130 [Blastocatellia bacterium]|nr:hypothetical protein [Blastocatellia bacterium]
MKHKGILILLLLLAMGPVSALAQQPADKKDPAPADEGKVGNYTVTSSVELGVRGISVNGEADKFRSDFNYRPGFHVFNSSLLMRAPNNDGVLFDTLLINSYGWGADPNQYLRVSAEKTKWYRFNADYRQMDYFNSLRNFAAPPPLFLSQHISNTEYKVGDFDLTLLPQNERVRFNVGYSLQRNNGPSVSTYDYARDEFPILVPVRVDANDFRFGVDAKLWVFDLSFQQGFRYYKEDTTYDIDLPVPVPVPLNPGNNPTNQSVLTGFHREFPTRGRTPYTRFTLHTLLARKVDFTGRFVYSSATTRHQMFETLKGKDFSGNNIVLDRFEATGNAKRPNGLGDVGVTVFATDKLRISDTFRINSFRVNGGDHLTETLLRTRTTPFGETPLPPVFVDNLALSLTKYRRALNTLEVDYEFHPKFTAHVGHRYSDRRIEIGTLTKALGSAGELEPESFDNRTNTWFAGFKARPATVWTVYFDMERGETDNVFTRVENYDFTNLRLRSVLKPVKTLALNFSMVTKDNNNPARTDEIPPRDFGADINSRSFTASADWVPNQKFSLNTGYTYTRVTSEAAIIFFVSSLKREGMSRYFLRDNFAYVNLFAQLTPRMALSAGYRIHHDSGQGDRVGTDLTQPISGTPELIFSYPQQFQSPEVRVAFKLHEKLDWNVGYQFYSFAEKFQNLQHYNAHLPYTSLRFYFGGRGGQ